jgi:hypothetical protein
MKYIDLEVKTGRGTERGKKKERRQAIVLHKERRQKEGMRRLCT